MSDQKQPQATQVVDDVLRSIVLYQTARYSRDCRVFAPVYRQVTIQGLFQPGTVTPEMREQGYDDVLEAWRTYLRRYNHGRGVVLIGHSQGTFVLRRLIREEIDPKASARRRLVSAVLLGGNVTVRKGSDRGGDFKRVRACRRARPDRLRGRVLDLQRARSRRRALRADERARARDPLHEPGRARGRLGEAHADLPERPVRGQRDRRRGQLRPPGLPRPKTPWAGFPDAYSGKCSKAGGASVLQVKPLRGAFPFTPTPDATWGLHLADANIALGELANLVKRQIHAYD